MKFVDQFVTFNSYSFLPFKGGHPAIRNMQKTDMW